ncbi:MAG: hypothetical protein WBG48_07245 [Pricia sp.]
MRKFKTVFIVLGFLFSTFFVSCDKGTSPEEFPITDTNPIVKTIGLLPLNGELCSDYELVPDEVLEILVLFKWNTIEKVKNYALVVYDGTDEITRISAISSEVKVRLQRGKTYSWTIIAINGEQEILGDTYSFTTPGVPLGNYAPYAADISLTVDATNTLLSIEWVGADEDDDALTYDVSVYRGEEVIQEFFNISDTFLQPFSVGPETAYTVKVISKDGFGNFSVSKSIFQN